MPRNMDMTALRSFAAVAEVGGITRASGFLNLTQSAVSMQLKRLEESLDLTLLDRSARTVALTAAGEQLLGYARRILDLNDEALSRLTDQKYEGEVVLGVPHDIVYPAIPQVLSQFAAEHPRLKVQLVSSYTRRLKEMFARGECDMILTTEDRAGPDCEQLMVRRVVWVGAPGGNAWKRRPLRLAFEYGCIFREPVEAALDRANIPWEMAVESNSSRTIEASVSADLAVHAAIEGSLPPYFEPIQHGGALPELIDTSINLYRSAVGERAVCDDLASLVRQAYQTLGRAPMQLVARG